MRGWHNEPARHSLASRGISTYLYHGTTSIPFRRIKEIGLDPENPVKFFETRDFVYFMKDPLGAMQWSDINMPHHLPSERRAPYIGLREGDIESVEPILLRVRKKDIEGLGGNIRDLGRESLVGGEEVSVDVLIPPEFIDFYDETTEEWIPLRDVR